MITSTIVQAFNAVSIAAAGSASYTLEVGGARRVRWMGTVAGANVSVKLQTSPDGGVTWLDLVSLAAGAVAVAGAVVELAGDKNLRVLASNAGTGAQTITGYVAVEGND